MKTLISIIFFASIACAQTQQRQGERGERQLPIILADPQPAQDVVIHLSADAATAMESLRLSTPGERDSKGITAPQFATIQDLWIALANQKIRQIIQQFPPQSVKVAQDAAQKALKDAAAVAEAAAQGAAKAKP